MVNRKILRMLGVIIIVVILTTSAVVFALSPKKNLKPSDYDIGESYNQAVKNNKPTVVLFYADWCTYCIKFMPKFKVLSDVYKDRYNFVMINAENSNYQKVVEDYAIGSFPTIYIIDPAIDNRILISNTLYDDLSKVRKELDRYLRIRSMIKE